MVKYIELTGYAPTNKKLTHKVLVPSTAAVVIEENALNQNSEGSILYVDGAKISVLENPSQVLKLIIDCFEG